MVAIASVIGTMQQRERVGRRDQQLERALPALRCSEVAAVVLTADHTPITLAPTAA